MNTREIAEQLWKLQKLIQAQAILAEAWGNSPALLAYEAKNVRTMANKLWELGIELPEE